MPRLSRLFLALTALFAAFATPAFAQPVAESLFRYTVQPGDTLSGLAKAYFVTKDFLTVQRLNKVADPRRLPTGSILLIPQTMLRVEPIQGTISSFRGDATANGQQVAVGTRVEQGMRIETGNNAFVTVSLPDGSAISLPSQSRIIVSRLRKVLITDSIERRFRLEAGRSRASVTPIRDPNGEFQVTTPLSVSAVRGTDFRVAFDETEGKALTEVVGGTVGVAKDEDSDETGVPRGYGVIATPTGVGNPVALLPPPVLDQLAQAGGDGVVVTARPVDGAVRYRFQLATDINFREVFAETLSDVPTITFQSLASTRFFIRITAIAASGLEGIPGTYAPGQRVTAPDGSLGWRQIGDREQADARAAVERPEYSVNTHGRPAAPSSITDSPLR